VISFQNLQKRLDKFHQSARHGVIAASFAGNNLDFLVTCQAFLATSLKTSENIFESQPGFRISHL